MTRNSAGIGRGERIRWAREEREECIAELRDAGRHRSDCVCRAVKDWSNGPACFQALRARQPQQKD